MGNDAEFRGFGERSGIVGRSVASGVMRIRLILNVPSQTSIHDLQIAIDVRRIVATQNLRDFERVPGLPMENWL
jgi:predicted nucleic acid-binding protein